MKISTYTNNSNHWCILAIDNLAFGYCNSADFMKTLALLATKQIGWSATGGIDHDIYTLSLTAEVDSIDNFKENYPEFFI